MIVAKKSYESPMYPIYDNYAYDLERYNNYTDRNRDINKKNKEKTKEAHAKKVKNKLTLITIVLLMFGLGTLIIGRYALIMNLSSQCITIKNKISENQKVNEDLKLQLMKYSDIKQIEKDATTKLSMTRPANNSIISLNINTESKDVNPEKAGSEAAEVSILNKLVGLFNYFKGA